MRSRHSHIACAGLLLAFYMWPVAAEPERVDYRGYRTQKAAINPNKPSALVSSEPKEPAVYTYSCISPKSHDDAELCIEGWIARSTRKQVVLAQSALWLGVVSLILIALTLCATGIAAFAAWRAGKLAKQALTDFERPHLFINILPNLTAQECYGHEIACAIATISNYGKFPADVLHCNTGITQIGHVPQSGIRDDLFICVIGPNKTTEGIEIPFPPGSRIEFEYDFDNGQPIGAVPSDDGSFDTFISIEISYKGLPLEPYTTDFCWIWDHEIRSWRPHSRKRT